MAEHTKHLPSNERKAVTIEAVIQLAAQHNPSEITTTAIARHMGVTQGALFKHFPTKESIIEAVMEWVAEQLLARVDKATQTAIAPIAALEAIFMNHANFVAEHPGVPRMLFGELQRAEMTMPKRMAQTLIRRYGERLHRLIEAGKDSGEISTLIETGSAVTLFIGTIQGLVMQSLLAGDAKLILNEAQAVFALYRRAIGNAS